MNHAHRKAIEHAADARRRGIAEAKGPEYSQAGANYQAKDADTLKNFKSVAERTGMTPVQCLMVYLTKHLDSINTTVREAESYSTPTMLTKPEWRQKRYMEGEGIVSRLDDARNYFDLLECLLVDTGAIEDTSPTTELFQMVAESAARFGEPSTLQPGQRGDITVAKGYGENLPSDLSHQQDVVNAERKLEAAKVTEPAQWVPPTVTVGLHPFGFKQVSGYDAWRDPNGVLFTGHEVRTAVREGREPQPDKDQSMVFPGEILKPSPPVVVDDNGDFEHDPEKEAMGFDGKWRPKAAADDSVKPGTPPQTPMYLQAPNIGEPETGEDDGR